jgi:hypothetical protein
MRGLAHFEISIAASPHFVERHLTDKHFADALFGRHIHDPRHLANSSLVDCASQPKCLSANFFRPNDMAPTIFEKKMPLVCGVKVINCFSSQTSHIS